MILRGLLITHNKSKKSKAHNMNTKQENEKYKVCKKTTYHTC